jgi:hypothetical protein
MSRTHDLEAEAATYLAATLTHDWISAADLAAGWNPPTPNNAQTLARRDFCVIDSISTRSRQLPAHFNSPGGMPTLKRSLLAGVADTLAAVEWDYEADLYRLKPNVAAVVLPADVEAAGRTLAAARQQERDAAAAAKSIALTALGAGWSESATARALGVTTMTVRTWRGKR